MTLFGTLFGEKEDKNKMQMSGNFGNQNHSLLEPLTTSGQYDLNFGSGYKPPSFTAQNFQPKQIYQMQNQGTGAQNNLGSSGFSLSNIPGIPSPMAWKDMNWSQRLFGFEGKDGYEFGGLAMPALQLAQGGLNAYTGMKQLGIAEDSLAFQKDAFSKQFENQRKLTNAQLEDRQKSRVAFGPSATPVDEYMKKYGV